VVPGETKCAALTFDDGPGPYTAQLLDDLARRDAHATFFVVGRNVEARPQLVRAAVEHGHEIGNHSYDHVDLTALEAGAIRRQIDRTSEAVLRATGRPPVLARPPYGETSVTVADVLLDRGCTQVLWDVDSEDWRNGDAARTTTRVLEGARHGAIILMHDVFPTTVDAVPAIVDGLLEQDYALVTVSELLASQRSGPGSRPHPG